MNINDLKLEFKKVFGHDCDSVYFSPGRVNLIGEHIDYNGGYVFPLAINMGTYGILSKRQDGKMLVYSHGFTTKPYEFVPNDFEFDKENFWANYVKGMFQEFKKFGFVVNQGFELYIYGNIPNGAGLSSSASLEMLIGYIIKDLNNIEINRPALAIFGQGVENHFIGLSSGIMDQFVIANAKKNKAILLDTRTLKFNFADFNLGDNSLVVGFTNKKRELADSKYNERFAESMKALKILQKYYDIKNLCQLPLVEVEKHRAELGEVLFKRTKHIVTEQKRTIDFYDALNRNDLKTICEILLAGHKSLQEDYEVSGIELDTLVWESVKYGALGARQTGAGFGGCMIAIVPNDKIAQYAKNVTKVYKEKIGYKPEFYVVKSSDGVSKIE